MGCSCRKNAVGEPVDKYTVVIPGGKRKVYTSQVAAMAMATQTGGYVIPPSGISLDDELAQLVTSECVGANC